MDFASHGLLEGLKGDARTARERLLTHLVQDGCTLEQLTKAVRENRLALVPVDRVLGGTHSAVEIERRTGLPAHMMIRIRQLHGLDEVDSESRVFSDQDLEAARTTKQFLEAGFGEEAIVEITRVLGEGMARLGATITAAFVETFLDPGDSEEQVAQRFAALAEQLTPALTPVLVAGFRAHLRDSVERGMLGRTELEAGAIAATRHLAVCFADVVGFTRLGGQLEVTELGTVAARLAQLAASVTQPPVRLIKTIGDAAMFVSPDPAPLVKVALGLVNAFEQEELPSLRAGIASGRAVLRAGDYYGHSVNLASRVTGIARPGSVLCTQEIHDAASRDLDWSAAGHHRLKGVSGLSPLYRARLLAEDEQQPSQQATKRHRGRARKRARG